jgi:nitrate reductase gamma subunit
MNEEYKGVNPKLVIAVQMLCIGIVLLILGITVFLLSPIRAMEPFIRTQSLISNGSISLVGIAFTIGGFFRLKKVKKA